MSDESTFVYRIWSKKRQEYIAASPWGAHRRTVWMTPGAVKGVYNRLKKAGLYVQDRNGEIEIHKFELMRVAEEEEQCQ